MENLGVCLQEYLMVLCTLIEWEKEDWRNSLVLLNEKKHAKLKWRKFWRALYFCLTEDSEIEKVKKQYEKKLQLEKSTTAGLKVRI